MAAAARLTTRAVRTRLVFAAPFLLAGTAAVLLVPRANATPPKHVQPAYGNQIFVEQGAVPVAHTGVIEEMKRYETGYYDGKPGRWEGTGADGAAVDAGSAGWGKVKW